MFGGVGGVTVLSTGQGSRRTGGLVASAARQDEG